MQDEASPILFSPQLNGHPPAQFLHLLQVVFQPFLSHLPSNEYIYGEKNSFCNINLVLLGNSEYNSVSLNIWTVRDFHWLKRID